MSRANKWIIGLLAVIVCLLVYAVVIRPYQEEQEKEQQKIVHQKEEMKKFSDDADKMWNEWHAKNGNFPNR